MRFKEKRTNFIIRKKKKKTKKCIQETVLFFVDGSAADRSSQHGLTKVAGLTKSENDE
jgi:hypothetical protein